MNPVHVVGIGLGPEDLTERHREIIRQSDILVGGRRHLAYFKNHPGKKKVITGDMRGLINHIKTQMNRKQIVVLASGDPNFFGIGPLLVASLGAENVVIHPNISSVAAAFSRIKQSWDDARVVSLHGKRPEKSFLDAVARNNKVAVLTDSKKTPGWLAMQLIDAGHEKVRMCVLENLGTPQEQIAWYSPAEAASKEFAKLNVVIVLKSGIPETAPVLPLYFKDHPQLHLGMPEDCYHHEAGIITKAEVRAISISKLCLWPGLVLWDLGAGSGSVALEASLLLKGGKIIAVEQNPERVNHVKQNKKQFKVRNLDIVQTRLPGGLKDLLPPDRIFIGGGGKDLMRIIKAAAGYLKPGGVMVVNTILFRSLEGAIATLQRLGFSTEVVQVQVNRGKAMPSGERLEALNPVWIISGYR
ncbi:MAG: bifunctional cobalt-precorrin-7 (C(5))-methyltransferase/cobalt-precorrin-6B (C(15))-methyltransferase [Deltaproteobacteria bacterium]|nr:MAG: bifunctional cobalt-precorrin-7 (C(5))-methyltransferase/cobalt-precorrin-6B (C(15))-methyltransferase [Deltaproteobacteria bacterium]